MYITVNDNGCIEVYTEEDDACYTCDNISSCPLIVSLQNELTILHYESINVEECGLYKDMENVYGRSRSV